MSCLIFKCLTTMWILKRIKQNTHIEFSFKLIHFLSMNRYWFQGWKSFHSLHTHKICNCVGDFYACTVLTNDLMNMSQVLHGWMLSSWCFSVLCSTNSITRLMMCLSKSSLLFSSTCLSSPSTLLARANTFNSAATWTTYSISHLAAELQYIPAIEPTTYLLPQPLSYLQHSGQIRWWSQAGWCWWGRGDAAESWCVVCSV